MVFDPRDDNSTLVWSVNDNYTVVNQDYAADVKAREDAIRERDMRNVGFGRRESYCG